MNKSGVAANGEGGKTAARKCAADVDKSEKSGTQATNEKDEIEVMVEPEMDAGDGLRGRLWKQIKKGNSALPLKCFQISGE